jgi:hypothetical protein
MEEADITQLNSRFQPDYKPPDKKFYISLAATNQKDDEINEIHLKAVKGVPHRFEAKVKGDFSKEYYPTTTELTFNPSSEFLKTLYRYKHLINNNIQRCRHAGLGPVSTSCNAEAAERV